MWVRVRSYDVIVGKIKFEDNGIISKEVQQLGENGEISKKVNFNLICKFSYALFCSRLLLSFSVSKGRKYYKTVLCATINYTN